MPKLVELFEDLIKRTLAPSAAFFFLVAVVCFMDSALHGHEEDPIAGVLTAPDVLKNTTALVALSLLALLGTSYTLAMIHKALFDDRLKGNFEARIMFQAENNRLECLREKVVDRVQVDLDRFSDFDHLRSDYLLYEILGGIDPIDLRAYVDRAKSFGITSVSLMLVLTGWAIHLVLDSPPLIMSSVLLVVLVVGVWAVTWEAMKAEYRARAIRLYVNFLAMPNQRLEALLMNGGKQPEISKVKNT